MKRLLILAILGWLAWTVFTGSNVPLHTFKRNRVVQGILEMVGDK